MDRAVSTGHRHQEPSRSRIEMIGHRPWVTFDHDHPRRGRLARSATQPRCAQPTHQLARVDELGARTQSGVEEGHREVVVIPLVRQVAHAYGTCEVVQLTQARVTHQVRPPRAVPFPAWFVEEDRHECVGR